MLINGKELNFMTDRLFKVGDKFKIIETMNNNFQIGDIFYLHEIKNGKYPYLLKKKDYKNSTLFEIEIDANFMSTTGVKFALIKKIQDGISTKDNLPNKPHYRAISPYFLHDMAIIFRQGIKKHGLDSHRNIQVKDAGEIFDALLRHVEKIRLGEFFDIESQQPHLAHAGCNLSILMDLYEKYSAEDIIKSINGGGGLNE